MYYTCVFMHKIYDQGICTYVRITLCTPTFLSPFFLPSTKVPHLVTNCVTYPHWILVLHLPLASLPSQIAGTGEELQIQKTQTLATVLFWRRIWKQIPYSPIIIVVVNKITCLFFQYWNVRATHLLFKNQYYNSFCNFGSSNDFINPGSTEAFNV